VARAPELVETHMSWVYLTPRHAYKVKKPLQLAYVDNRTAPRRKASCEKELRLGARLAPGVYEQLRAVVRGGEIVDWLVVMRRLPADRMLPAMLAHGDATLDHADALADVLAEFYTHAPRTAETGDGYVARLRELVRLDGVELAVRGGPGLAARVLRAIDREAAALAARVGRVVDGHGDLRPEHVCLEPPLVIDPLELDDLRMIDAASELAYFALECERLDASWFGQRVFARYCHRTGDSIAPAVLAIYRAQHALARALIALRHMDDGPSDPARWRTRAADYLARAS
jgi:aminoglycoside phosphotransferase family enzyme